MFEKLKQILIDEFDLEDIEITEDTSFEDLGFDYLDMIDFAMDMEDVFEVEVSDDVVESFRTVGDVMDFLEKG